VLGLELAPDQADGASATRAQGSPNSPLDSEVVFTEGLPPGDHLAGLDRVSFEVPSPESVDRVYEKARTRNARATQPRLYEGHWQTFIFDPDGYKVEVFAQHNGADND
jgi:catechol 2,3-dioxygenase-like lactoylglutathione lyase family enzyme